MDRPRVLSVWRARLDQWHQTVERRGQLPLYDAVALGDGRFLVALGHTGLAVLSGRGAFAQRFATPTHRLVAPLRGERYVTVSQGRLGVFHRGRVAAWCSAEIDGYAEVHDGSQWLVWRGLDLYVIALPPVSGARAPYWRALEWLRLPEIPSKLSVGLWGAGILMSRHAQFYACPGLRRTSTTPLANERRVLAPHGYYQLSFYRDHFHFKGVRVVVDGELLDASFQEPYALLISRSQGQLTLCLFDISRPLQQTVVRLPGAGRATARVCGGLVVICDNLGRLLVVDPRTQQWSSQLFL